MKIITEPEKQGHFVIERAFETEEGYHGVCVMAGQGHRCGYVGVPEDHVLYGSEYNDLYYIDVHGGLTYSGVYDALEVGYWYLGFDCAHAGDSPDTEALTSYGLSSLGISNMDSGKIWSLDDVVDEIQKLSKQMTPEALMKMKMEND